ncbi:cation:proton antiporter [Sporomusa termitida]|uniref:Glutathione-regulated potassium-efflux system protein KefB n=1 Tax=Sporomusa termitida TaxID=2377 RepID=A0A517DPI8_9FIRM|nr:cation:proton antiporter [Sporomusa termitida]QDR79186.1 Glutathione-regulated potassium-efflux system protein KefB [Sporomusa termitida]
MHIPELISDLALMLLVAGIMTLIFKRFQQPLVLGYIITGFMVGPYFTLVPAVTDVVSISTWSEIGIIILMFSLGLEFNLHKLASVGGTAIITAMTEVVSMLAIGFACGQLMGWSVMNSVFLGGMLSMSSTTIIIKAFEDLDLKGKKFTELVFGTLIIEDIAGIFMMVMLSTIAVSQGISGGELAGHLLKMIFYLALWLILGIYLLPTILKDVQKLMNDETLLIVSLGICFGMVFLANHLGFSSALGSFLAGSLLAGTIHAEKIEYINKPIKDLFGAVFFISVGMMVDPSLIVKYAGPIVVITIATIFGKAMMSTLGVLLSGQSLKTSILCGFSLAQIGEFSFIIAALGISLGVISDYIYSIVVSVSVITTFTTPFVIRAAEGSYLYLDKCLPKKVSKYLNRHTSENQSETEKDSDWVAFFKKYFTNLILYAVIILGIILAGTSLLEPFLAAHMPARLAALLATLVTLVLMAPFLKPCLFKKNEYFIPLWLKSATNHLPLIMLIVLRLGTLVFLIMLPFTIMLDFSELYILIVAIGLVFLIARSDWLIAPYLKIEARFLANFNERKLEERKGKNIGHSWLDERIHVSKFRCTDQIAVLDKTLADLPGTERSKLKIIKIIRGGKHINIPEGSEHIRANDIVFVAGNDKVLDSFAILTQVNLDKKADGCYATLREFIKNQEAYAEDDQLLCYAVTVEKDSDLAGVAIKDSKIKGEWGGFLLGLERDLYPILAPDINMYIQENDLVWILGTQRMAGQLAKDDLL